MRITPITLGIIILTTIAGTSFAQVAWENVLETKRQGLASAAGRAVQQQRTTSLPAVPLAGTWAGQGNVQVEHSDAWDADGDGQSYRITVRDVPENRHHVNIRDRVQVRFAEPVNILEKGTGIAFWVNAPEGLADTLRIGVHFKIEGTDQDPVVFADTPIVHRFGDNPHLIYIDLGYVFAHTVGVFQTPPKEFFSKVTGVDLTIVQKTLPIQPGQLEPTSGHFFIDGLQIVDWFEGSYDNARFPGNRINQGNQLVAQGRTQQVTVIAAMFGGEAGMQSAIRAMDMMARIQSWDGSWPEMRTRMQGEFTHGMIMADLARALRHMRAEERPELKEVVKVRHWEMPREQLYEQMLYRSAKSRSPAPLTGYRDSYASGDGAMRSGANRPMTYILGQHLIAQVLTDEAKKEELLAEYDLNMEMLLEYQGITAGGWPIFGEGNRHQGRGLHWDVSYTTDHVAIIANASRATGDARWGQIMRKFDTVVQAMMLPNGLRIDGAISERGNARSGGLKHADIVYQEAMKHNAPMLAQWGYNVSNHLWTNWPGGGETLWPNTRSFRGYALGAFLTWQVYDMDAEPQPKDLQVVFPRQWPVWTAKWMNKQGEQVRQSKLIVNPVGVLANTFEWEVGQYPVLSAVPIMPSVAGDVTVELQPVAYEGNVLKLPGNSAAMIATGPADGQLGQPRPMADDTAELSLSGSMQIRITVPNTDLDVRFNATPRGDGEAKLTVRLLRSIAEYEHQFIKEEAADAAFDKAGINMVAAATGTRVQAINCFPNAQYGMERALDGNAGTAWVIGQFLPESGLRFEFAAEVKLDKLVVRQGDWQNSFHLAKAMTIKFSDGTEKKFALEQKPGENQTLDLGGVKTKHLIMIVDEIYERENNAPNTGGWSNLQILTAGD